MSRVVLIGWGRAKAREPRPAAELYSGSLFRARRTYAEGTGAPWWIVSAEYGLVPPDALLRPYDLRITDLAEIDRSAWRLRTVAMLLDELDDFGNVTPSLVCPDDCGWHVWAVLEGWS